MTAAEPTRRVGVAQGGVAQGGARVSGVASGGATFGGVVVDGDKRGRLLGFPTANIAVADGGDTPIDGVYACWVSFPPEGVRHGATVSIGDNPTFDDVTDRRVEAFVHDLDADLYGRAIVVTIAARLRSMVRCASLDELIVRTKEDVEQSRALLAESIALPLSQSASVAPRVRSASERRR